ncbi:hypothetical protein FACS1894158_09940 [Betaproteobacteria bacterium]|nr:hypothetical protein FACS1894158_09940 [Betaproteobacteria bacterium]
MTELIVTRETLTDQLLTRIHSSRVLLREDGDTITLTPMFEKQRQPSKLFGMLAGSSLSTKEYSRQKQADKALE